MNGMPCAMSEIGIDYYIRFSITYLSFFKEIYSPFISKNFPVNEMID